MDFLTNIVCTLLAYSPELLFTYVIVAAIIVFCGTDVGLEGISGRKKLLSSTRGMPYPTRIITEDQLEDVFNAYHKPSMNEFIVQAKSATIASLSMVETHGAPEI